MQREQQQTTLPRITRTHADPIGRRWGRAADPDASPAVDFRDEELAGSTPSSTTRSACFRAIRGYVVQLMLAVLAAIVPATSVTAQPSRTAVALTYYTAAAPRDSVRPVPDRWFARDKAEHFVTSAVIQVAVFGALRMTGVRQSRALLAASTVTVGAGVGKEVWDARGHGDPSWRDLTWDGIGMVAGSGLAVWADRGH